MVFPFRTLRNSYLTLLSMKLGLALLEGFGVVMTGSRGGLVFMVELFLRFMGILALILKIESDGELEV